MFILFGHTVIAFTLRTLYIHARFQFHAQSLNGFWFFGMKYSNCSQYILKLAIIMFRERTEGGIRRERREGGFERKDAGFERREGGFEREGFERGRGRGGRGRGRGRGGPRPEGGRGGFGGTGERRREFDRHSGTDKT